MKRITSSESVIQYHMHRKNNIKQIWNNIMKYPCTIVFFNMTRTKKVQCGLYISKPYIILIFKINVLISIDFTCQISIN